MILYNILLTILFPLAVPYFIIRSLFLRRSMRRSFLQRFGLFSGRKRGILKSMGPKVLIHAVSVGETRAAIPLLKRIAADSDYKIVITNVTDTGHLIAQTIDQVALTLYMPFDFPFSVRWFLQTVRPEKLIIVETEIWPNLITEAHRIGIPVVIVNGRISDRSYKRYLQWSWFFGPLLQKTKIFAQTAEDKERFIAIGADPDSVAVAGNFKFDLAVSDEEEHRLEYIHDEFKLPEDPIPIFCAGSIHPDEFACMIELHRNLLAEGNSVISIFAPRHPEKVPLLADAVQAAGFHTALRTELPSRKKRLKSGDVLIVDTIGELLKIYSIADVVFVGGSFGATGGHNILEACSVGKPVVYGPNMVNFREIARIVKEWEAGCWVTTQVELLESVKGILCNEALATHMGTQGKALLKKNHGAVDMVFAHVFQSKEQ